jgi:hypothetical protein
MRFENKGVSMFFSFLEQAHPLLPFVVVSLFLEFQEIL